MLNTEKYIRLQTCFNIGVNKVFIVHLDNKGRGLLQSVVALRHERTFAVSVPDDFPGHFHSLNHSGHNMALGSTQSIKQLSNRDISRG